MSDTTVSDSTGVKLHARVEHETCETRHDANNLTPAQVSSTTSSSSSSLPEQEQEIPCEIQNCVYKLTCIQCRRPFTFSLQLKHESSVDNHDDDKEDNKLQENCTQISNNNNDSTNKGSSNNVAESTHNNDVAHELIDRSWEQKELQSNVKEEEKMCNDSVSKKICVQDWYNCIATEMYKMYNIPDVELERYKNDITENANNKCGSIPQSIITHTRNMLESLDNKVQSAQMSLSHLSVENDNENKEIEPITSEEELTELLQLLEELMCYLVTHYRLKQPLCSSCWREELIPLLVSSATQKINRLENLLHLLPEWNSEEMRCMCNSIKSTKEEQNEQELQKEEAFLLRNINKDTFTLDTIANNLFSSKEGALLCSLTDKYREAESIEFNCEEEHVLQNSNQESFEKEECELRARQENTCTVALTCNGPNVLVLPSVYNKQQSLLKQVEDAERAALDAEKANSKLQHELFTLQEILTNRHALHNEWEEMNRHRAMCNVASQYKYMDEAARRENNIKVNLANLQDVRHLPLYVLAFPIDVRGEIATIDGLRLCFVGSSEKMESQEQIYSFLSEHHQKTSLEEEKCEWSESNHNERKANQKKLDYYCLNGETGEMHTQFIGDWSLQKAEASLLFGKLTDKVPISEVNTACGLLCELLTLIAQHHLYSFSHAILHPHGAQSTISILKQPSSDAQATSSQSHNASVAGTVDFYISERFFAWRTFPSACEAVADCVHELCRLIECKLAHARNEELIAKDNNAINLPDDHDNNSNGAECKSSLPESNTLLSQLESANRNVNVHAQSTQEVMNKWMQQETTRVLLSFPPVAPYRITKGAIDGMCIRHGSVNETAWSLAMKKLLTNVQWCVAASALL